ncbi:MAG: ATP-binding cassette domain-containing protein [Planctomycetia bacterium]
MLELHGVSKSFDGRVVVQPTDLLVTRGGTTAILGPSGCGKSTLLRMLAGLIAPDAGRVVFDGETIGPSNARTLRRRMGFVLQDGGLFPHLTGRDNVALPARTDSWPKSKIDDRVELLRELMRLPLDVFDRFPVQLSGGQRQRLGLMRGLMLDPDVVLLDEPMGALDPLVRFDLQEDLGVIFRTLGKTVVLVTHDLAEAAFLADRLVIVHGGKIVAQGKPAEVRAAGDPFVTRFFAAQRASIAAIS